MQTGGPRGNININPIINTNQHQFQITRLDDPEGDYDVVLTAGQLAGIVREFSEYLVQKLPVYGMSVDDRTDLEIAHNALSGFLNRELDEGLLISSRTGIVYASASREGNIEFRTIDVDLETEEFTGGRIYKVSPAIAGQWLNADLAVIGQYLSVDDLVTIRSTVTRQIDTRLRGDKIAEAIDAFKLNAAARFCRESGDELGALSLSLFEQSDLDRINTYCDRHPERRLDAAMLLRGAAQLDKVRRAAIRVSVELADKLAASLGGERLSQSVAAFSETGGLTYTEIDREAVARQTADLYATAFVRLESGLKAALTAVTMADLRMYSKVDTIADFVTNKIIDDVIPKYEQTGYAVQLDPETIQDIANAVNAYYWDALGNTFIQNEYDTLILTGQNAGKIGTVLNVPLNGLVYPIKK